MSQVNTGSESLAHNAERLFVERMRTLRQQRGWSQERLAAEVEARTGFTLAATAITKLEWALLPERADKARGLRVGEAVAIAETFGHALVSMVSPDLDLADDPLQLLRKSQADVEAAHLQLAQVEIARDLAAVQVEAARQVLLAVTDRYTSQGSSDGEHPETS